MININEVSDLNEAPQGFESGRVQLIFVDDDPNNHTSFKMAVYKRLKDFAGSIDVSIFHHSDDLKDFLGSLNQQALSKVVVVTDNDMGSMISGTQLATFIKGKNPDFPIAIWSGRSESVKTDAALPKDVAVFYKLEVDELFNGFVRPKLTAAIQLDGLAVPKIAANDAPLVPAHIQGANAAPLLKATNS